MKTIVKQKAQINSFIMLVKQLSSDSMLLLVCIAPILAGIVFKFVLPFLAIKFSFYEILKPYFLLIDLFICQLSSYMLCFVSSMLILSEIDEKVSTSLIASPVGKKGYLFSRLGFPAIISIIYSFIIGLIFFLNQYNFVQRFVISTLASVCSIIASMLIVCIAKNRVEGMAIAKTAGIIVMGIAVPFFFSNNISLLFGFFPTIWLSFFALSNSILQSLLYIFLCLLISSIWIIVLWKQFEKKCQN